MVGSANARTKRPLSDSLGDKRGCDDVRKTVGSLLVLACLCLPASAQQTPEACRAQLRHFTVPEYPRAFSYVVPTGWVKLPSRLLISQNGIEVYANTFPDSSDLFLNQISATGMEVLVVYQDETVRQATISQLREKHLLPPAGMGALVENLKYAKILFTPKWLPSDLVLGNKMGNPFDREWQVGHIEYDQPSQCLNVFQNDNHPTLFNAYTSSTSIITETNPPWTNQRLPVDASPLWTKSLKAMLAWTKECLKLVDPLR